MRPTSFKGHLYEILGVKFYQCQFSSSIKFNTTHFLIGLTVVSIDQVTLCRYRTTKWPRFAIPKILLQTLTILSCCEQTEMMLSMAWCSLVPKSSVAYTAHKCFEYSSIPVLQRNFLAQRYDEGNIPSVCTSLETNTPPQWVMAQHKVT